jgi:uncharacterized protein
MNRIQQLWLSLQKRDRLNSSVQVNIVNNETKRHQLFTTQEATPTIESAPSRYKSRIFVTKPALSLLLTASLVLLVGIAPGTTQERKPSRTLTASGKGIVTIPTTLSQIRLAIEVSGKTPANAQQEAARRSTQVVNYLKAQRVDKLQTAGINLNPTYTYPRGGNPQIAGYTATNSISFRVVNDRAGTILDTAIKNGATRIDGVSFVASELAISTAQLQALKQATQDAQRQADTVLATLNLKRKEVIGIQLSSASTPTPIPLAEGMMRSKASDAIASTTPVVGGEQQVEASVTLDIGY